MDELIRGINGAGRHRLDRELLEEIVREDEKQRYSFNEDHTLIRANQGHSIPVDVELEEKLPPAVLYHGTGEKYVPSIDAQGLLHIIGRKKEILVLRDGTKIFLPEYEAALQPLLPGRDFAVTEQSGAPVLVIFGEESERETLTRALEGRRKL